MENIENKQESAGKTVEKLHVSGVPFKKGDDPRRNLNGRPKGTLSITTIVKNLLINETIELESGKKIPAGEALSSKIIRQALKGDTQTQKLIWNYIDGMPRQGIELTGKDGQAIEIKNVRTEFTSRIAGILTRIGKKEDNK